MNEVKTTSPFPIRGTVEGFYGPPWTHATRLKLLDFTAGIGMNAYIYAPKDDPFHRERWRESYPAAEERKLVELIAACRRNGMTFCWALSPGLTIRYASRADFERVVEKMRRVMNFGARRLALFLDDIPDVLQHAADKRRFPSLAAAQADILNRLHAALTAIEPDAELWFCPTEYIGTRPSPYLSAIGRGVRPEIGIFWTGPLVVSPSITADDARAIAAVLRRKPLLWDNYPVNDYNRWRLNMGPLRARDARISNWLAGYFSNPMNEAEASKIPLLTISNYLVGPAEYGPEAAWARAIIKFAGRKHATAMKLFVEQHRTSFFVDEPPPEAARLFTAYRDARDTGARCRAATAIRAYMRRLAALPAQLADLPNTTFHAEIKPHLRALAERAALVCDALDVAEMPASPKRYAAARRLRKRHDAVLARRFQTASGFFDAFIADG